MQKIWMRRPPMHDFKVESENKIQCNLGLAWGRFGFKIISLTSFPAHQTRAEAAPAILKT